VKLLLELAEVANLKRISKIEIFDGASLKGKSSKFNDLYLGLTSGKLRSDREAAKTIYQTVPSDDRYRQLKSRFRKRLLNTVFFLNLNAPLKARYEQAYAESQKEWALINLLRLYDANDNVHAMSRQLLTICKKHHFTDLSVQVLTLLVDQAIRDENENEFKEYHGLLKEAMVLYQAETEARFIYQQVKMRLHQITLPISKAEWADWQNSLIRISELNPSPKIQYLSYLIGARHYFAFREFGLAITIAQQTEGIFKQYPHFFSQEDLYEMRYIHMLALLAHHDFNGAAALSEVTLRKMEPGSTNWLNFLNLSFLSGFHAANYPYAYQVLQKVFSYQKFKLQPESVQQMWSLYRAALFFFLRQNSRKHTTQYSSLFDPVTFMQSPALFEKDQRILTIWTLIIQLLYLIENKLFNKAAENIERLKHYARHQLNTETQIRTIAFIRCLNTLVKAEFNPENVNETNKYYLSLLDTPPAYNGHLDQLEIIPFHTLWVYFTELLKPLNIGNFSSQTNHSH
jgi:hypothetical protein